MRILVCSNAYPPHFVGGAELVAHDQAKALARLGHEIRVFASNLNAGGERHARTDDLYEDIPISRLATVPEDYSPEFLNFLHPRIEAEFCNILQSFKPDIIHCHNLIGLSAKLPIIARQFGVRTVCTLHDYWGFCLRNTAIRSDGRTCEDVSQCLSCLPRIHDGRLQHVPMRFRKDFMRLALDHIDRFIAPSRYIADRYVWAGFSEEQIIVIANGVDLDRFQPVPYHVATGDVVISYIGYLGDHKGVATLIEAMSLLPRNECITLQLVGEGPEQARYLAQAETLGQGARVRFLGKVRHEDMPEIYRRSDIVVLPSIWAENQPVCLNGSNGLRSARRGVQQRGNSRTDQT